MRGDKPHLRTRVGAEGMDYKGFNIAIHELGHNVEQVLSLEKVDSTLLAGVPNTAFTEALAFVFQARDLSVLDLPLPDERARRLAALNDLWGGWEIAGVALVDIGVWRWMYQHPAATPAELREATVALARQVWNRWYAPVLGVRDSPLLAVYSHMIHSALYLPDYPIGHLIQAQLEAHFDTLPADRLGAEFERMASYGSVGPDLWMTHATGSGLSARPLLTAARRALEAEAAGGP
jgi:oligoendopeptidase F